MSMIETPYRVAPKGTNEHEFDLHDMGSTQTNFIMGIGGGGRPFKSITSTVNTTAEDYHKQFREKLRKVDPPQRVRAFLDHHLEHYQQANGNPAPFLDHLKYVVLHPLEAVRAKSPQVAAAFDWFNKIMDSMHKQHQVTKAKFLSRAFELALEKDPAKPTRVQVTLEEMATLMDIDAATARRIRDELAQDGLVNRIGNYPMFLIEPEGRRAVERMHTEGGSTLPTIVQNNYNASGGSVLQVATNSPHATQTASVGDEIQDARTFVQQLSTALPEIEKVAPADQFNEIKDELEFLRKKLDSTAPSKTVIKTINDELIKRVVGLPFDAAKWFGPEILERL
jgi:hypothetical protein